ncbi:NRDE family protein [Alteromonas sp. PRIM-21]|uniref:NRDE family protein n=1 Tax=Alteromonas sp. PRIM-21 TaxID=1454978 RepID=UPI0022B99BF7|nr:NRDE family protein [Alteromonas sp. PRIM-21]MCZ8531581.1 NRDE family protein [Alteromonas sp. PRIM-21]
MCILFIANKMRDDYPLIIAANRDEFYARPTAPSTFWESHPHLLAGQDLEANGTWMGVTRNGKIAALTNVRDPHNINKNAVSRGELVANWLKQNPAQKDYAEQSAYLATLEETRHQYNGYNLLFGDVTALRVYNNVNNSTHSIDTGVYGLSNADIATPWPKVTQGVTALNDYVQQQSRINNDDLFNILRHENKAEDALLPDTGIGYEWEKALSSIFIQTEKYGTRTSTLLLVDKNNTLTWKERRFSDKGEAVETRAFSFSI